MSAKTKGILAFVFGILGIVCFWVPFFNTVPLILSVVGIVLGVKGRKEADDSQKGLCTAGLVFAIIGTVFCGIGFVTCTVCTGLIVANTDPSMLTTTY